jgi:putative phosphoribosyl transferase
VTVTLRPQTHALRIPVNHVSVDGTLKLPSHPVGLVVFAHGSGSGRFSPRNRTVAQRLRKAHYATLLLDLLTEGEQRVDQVSGEYRFDIALLARRLAAVVDFVAGDARTRGLPIAVYGASTGAAAALAAAVARPDRIRAVVSRGGRPDLVADALPLVKAPTLFLVGGADAEVLALHKPLLGEMHVPAQLQLIPGAGHLFEGPGELEQVAACTVAWLRDHLPSLAL